MQRVHACDDDALARTIGSLARAPQAEALNAVDRGNIVRWRDVRWEALEQRASRIMARDATAWYEHLVCGGPDALAPTRSARHG